MRRLSSLQPVLQVANLRRPLASALGVDSLSDFRVAHGMGQVGDVVVGDVVPCAPSHSVEVMDHTRTLRRFPAGRAVRVLAPLGNRQSSTHYDGGVPDGGVATTDDGLVWLTGSSGLVGKATTTTATTSTAADSHTAPPLRFKGLGLLHHPVAGDVVNTAQLAVSPTAQAVTKPIIAVAATSAEAGKTTLAKRIVRVLTQLGVRCATVKATGTGGVGDFSAHLEAGAVAAFDQVEGGLPTTYCDADSFRPAITKSLLAAESVEAADVLLVEQGGDIVWANNPTLMRMPAFTGTLAAMFVICNDALALYGVHHILQSQFPGLPVQLVASPFRNVTSMQLRADALLPPTEAVRVMDPRDTGAIARVLSAALHLDE